MKKYLLALAASALTTFAAVGASTSGHIYSILPYEAADVGATFTPGDTVKFRVRLYAPDIAETKPTAWSLVPSYDFGSSLSQFMLPKMGVIVSGQLREAEFVKIEPYKDNNGGFPYTDLIFGYKVQYGDLALPMGLALEGSTDKNPIAADGSSSAKPYYFDATFLGWTICSRDANNNAVTANLYFCSQSEAASIQDNMPGSEPAVRDFNLAAAELNVKALDFNVESTIRLPEKKSGTITLAEKSAVSATYYVWSDNPDAVDMSGAVQELEIDADGTKRNVAVIKIESGKTTYAFELVAKGQKGTSANIILSPTQTIKRNAAGDLDPSASSCITKKVVCGDPKNDEIRFEIYDEAAGLYRDTVTVSTPKMPSDGSGILPVKVHATVFPAPTVPMTVTVDVAGPDSEPYKHVYLSSENSAKTSFGGSESFFFEIPVPEAGKDIGEADFYIYPLGGNNDFASEGIVLKPVVVEDNYALIGATFKMAYDHAPEFVSPAAGHDFQKVTDTGFEVPVEISDCYYDLKYGKFTFTATFTPSDNTTDAKEFTSSTTKQTIDGYTASDTGATLTVTDQNGLKSETAITFSVKPKKTVAVELFTAPQASAPFSTGEAADEGTRLYVRYAVNEEVGAKRYVKLEGADETTKALIASGAIVSPLFDKAVPLNGNVTETTLGTAYYIDFKDGSAQSGDLQFKATLYKDAELTNVDNLFGADPLSVTVNNVNATPAKVFVNNLADVVANGATCRYSVPSGLDIDFETEIGDQGELDVEAGVWTIWAFNEGKGGTLRTTYKAQQAGQDGIAKTSYKFSPSLSGETTQAVSVIALDKDLLAAIKAELNADMKSSDLATIWRKATNDKTVVIYQVNVVIAKQPHIALEPINFIDGTRMNEDGNGRTARLRIQLSEFTGEDPLTVRVWAHAMTKNSPGTFDFAGGNTGVDPVTGDIYKDIVIPANSIEPEASDIYNEGGLAFDFATLNGTQGSQTAGWRVWVDPVESDQYKSSDKLTLFVDNLAPTVVTSPRADGTNTSAMVNHPFTIKWTPNDVRADVLKKLKCEWFINDSRQTLLSTNVTYNAADEIDEITTEITLKSEGLSEVKLVVSDSEGEDYNGATTKIWYYYINPTKKLIVTPIGPSGNTESRYRAAPGLGEGRVYANAQTGSAEGFTQTWTYPITDGEGTVYAFGYQAHELDDGTLKPFDKAIDRDGNEQVLGLTTNHYYRAANTYDNFFYRWIVETPAENGGLATKNYMIPQPTFSSTEVKQLQVALDPWEKDKLSYSSRKVEAVFSREYRHNDNLGDINLDGIPDIIASQYALGGSKIGEIPEDDFAELDEENEDNDFFPEASRYSFQSRIPGIPDGWAVWPFTAKMEIRGINDALNDAFVPDGTRPYKLSLPNHKYVREFEKPWDGSSYLSDEAKAYQEVLASLGPVAAAAWTPENPTDPTKEDTDGDGFPDGYEYYYWYWATVGHTEMNSTNWVHLTGERYNPYHPEKGDPITWQEIAAAFNPTDHRGIGKDYIDLVDMDEDGLPDTLELKLGTNPFHWDTDGDGMPDGWEVYRSNTNPLVADANKNDDGDFMAQLNLKGFTILAREAADKRAEYFATRVVPEFSTNTVGECWLIKQKGHNYIVPNADEHYDYTNFVNIAVGETPYAVYPEGSEELIKSCITNFVEGSETEIDTIITNFYDTAWTNFYVKANLGINGSHYIPLAEVSSNKVFEVTTNLVNEVGEMVEGSTNEVCFIRGLPAQLAQSLQLDCEPRRVELRELILEQDLRGDATQLTNRLYTAWLYGKKGGYVLGLETEGDSNLKQGQQLLQLSPNQTLTLLHHQVYQRCGFMFDSEEEMVQAGGIGLVKNVDMGTGFDPRTAWFVHSKIGELNERYLGMLKSDPVMTSEAKFGPVNTAAYTAIDEFLLQHFRYHTEQIDADNIDRHTQKNIERERYHMTLWREQTTMAGIAKAEGATEEPNQAKAADTDGDGVADGWELYVACGPAAGNRFRGSNYPKNVKDDKLTLPISPLTAGDATSNNNIDLINPAHQVITDLNLVEEFSGTDVAIAYKDCPTIAKAHPRGKYWLNKFWPTDPWNLDTDGDGIYDGDEGTMTAFIYGEPVDGGQQCIPGGGLNPCSWDTDRDGLPDPWEMQFPGVYLKNALAAKNASPVACRDYERRLAAEQVRVSALTNDTDKAEDKVVKSEFFCGGMNGTVADSYSKMEHSANLILDVNNDFDYDGLDPWQEYLTGFIRPYRYDDPASPWKVMTADDLPEEIDPADTAAALTNFYAIATITGFPLNPNTARLNEADEWIGGSNPNFVIGKFDALTAYGSRCNRDWDPAYGHWYFFADGPNHCLSKPTNIYTSLMNGEVNGFDLMNEIALGNDAKISQYCSTDPRVYDSDNDGMDDYYELYHGLNPLYGGKNGFDLVAGAWDNAGMLSARNNYWTYKRWDEARGEGDAKYYDFACYPWMSGDPNADPDGDDIINANEAIQANMQAPRTFLHTDPSPLWMTDRSYPGSIVNYYYRLPNENDQLIAEGELPTEIDGVKVPKIQKLGTHHWHVNSFNWSFEENEGYDSDHDGLSDFQEGSAMMGGKSDPQLKDDPMRRQAMYFPGLNSALQAHDDPIYGVAGSEFFFLEFTVECWIKPEDASADQVILERVIERGATNPAGERFYRRNFQLGIEGGCLYAAFDNNSDGDKRVVALTKTPITTDRWTHLAATYDGQALKLYINGEFAEKVESAIPPATPNLTVVTAIDYKEYFPHGNWDIKLAHERQTSADNHAIVFGAGVVEPFEDFYGSALTLSANNKWDRHYEKFYHGYLDEVRIWDGARSAAEISENYLKRFTVADALENRTLVFNAYRQGARRSPNPTTVSSTLIPELVYHYNFSGMLSGAAPENVATSPYGFTADIAVGGRAKCCRPEDYASPAWTNLAVRSEVYTDGAYVPWIPNTMAHLPSIAKTTRDSVYWSEDYAGFSTAAQLNYAKLTFPMEAELYARGYTVNPALATMPTRYSQLTGLTKMSQLAEDRLAFAARVSPLNGTDLLPLGGAYVRYTSDMWDGQGPSAVSNVTGEDANNNWLADWWEAVVVAGGKDGIVYTDRNGNPIDPATLNTKTIVMRNGVVMTALEAYRRDLAHGAHQNGEETVLNDPAYTQESDNNGNGLPDWWEEGYTLNGAGAKDDSDDDGLSNFDEYLLSELYPRLYQLEKYGITAPVLDPTSPRSLSGQRTTDYFLRYTKDATPIVNDQGYPIFEGNTYFGAIASDHDFMENWWENKAAAGYANSAKYDPLADADEDGWCNWAECRAALWGASFTAHQIDKWTGTDSSQHVVCYPEPILGVHVTYHGTSSIAGKPLVVRTISGQSARSDAKFVVPSELDGQTRYIGGFNADRVMHGHMSPGNLNANSIIFQCARTSSDHTYTWNCNWYKENESEQIGWDQRYNAVEHYNYWVAWKDCSTTHSGTFEEFTEQFARYPKIELQGGDFTWEPFCQVNPDADLTTAKILSVEGVTFGSVDCVTGEYEFDFSKFTKEGGAKEYVFRVVYTSRVGHEWPQTVYLSDTRELASGSGTGKVGSGRVREGKNTIEAFMDLDGDGEYTLGEPYGCIRNVDVGWHKVNDIVIELKDSSPVMDTLPIIGEGVNNRTVFVTRNKINNSECRRVFLKKEVITDDRAYISEADVTTLAQPDLDWGTLAADAKEIGIAKVESAEYSVYAYSATSSTNSTLIATFKKTFADQRPVATAVAPINAAPVYTSSPTFKFTASDESNKLGTAATAYRLEVANAEGAIVYTSPITRLPGRTGDTVGKSVYSITPAIFADMNGLDDGQAYKWRVALYNAKYFEDPAADGAEWSAWADFEMDIANKNRNPEVKTDCGSVGVAVRYYGPAVEWIEAKDIIVEAFANADFHGQPIAQISLATLENFDSNTDIDTPNATVRGIPVGKTFFRAYYDQNGNGKRDSWESWGYANEIGTGATAIYNPIYVDVNRYTDSKLTKVTIFMEDCDLNQNEWPDTYEVKKPEIAKTGAVFTADDDVAEEPLFESFDTDFDGIPDEFEIRTGMNPVDPADAHIASEGDVMAFVKTNLTVLTDEVHPALKYVVSPNEDKRLYTTFILPDGTLCVGAPTDMYESTFAGAGTIQDVTVIHSAVYDFYGYETNTARAVTNAVNTAAFTPYWKYITNAGYLPEFGVDYSPIDPRWSDSTNNGTPDGWELYVQFADAAWIKAFPAMLEDWVKSAFEGNIDPWRSEEVDTDGDGLSDHDEVVSGLDPFDSADADSAVADDVMAYEVITKTIVTLVDEDENEYYVILDSAQGVTGSTEFGGTKQTMGYIYRRSSGEDGVKTIYGLGREAIVPMGVTIKSVPMTAKVALVHDQVLAAHGFNGMTANPSIAEGERVNTKAFTLFDKIRVNAYREAMGLKPIELKLDRADSDGDGAPDGWELYVGLNPLKDEGTQDSDGDGIADLAEYDNGAVTNPFSNDTDGDGVTDNFAHQYHLQNGAAGLDDDGDGLSNYAEYLITEVFKYAVCDPKQYATGGGVCDYFKKVGELYLGEIFTDHDRMADTWERRFDVEKINPTVYDPDGDLDGDGWTNYSEFKAGTDPTQTSVLSIDGYAVQEHPTPVVEAEVVCVDNGSINAPVVFMAWNETVDPTRMNAPDAIWTLGSKGSETTTSSTSGDKGPITLTAHEKFLGRKPSGKRVYQLAGGSISEGSLRLCFLDKGYGIAEFDPLRGEWVGVAGGEPDKALWYYIIYDRNGELVQIGNAFDSEEDRQVVGSVNYTTGTITIDFDHEMNCGKILAQPSSENAGNAGQYHYIDLDNSYVKITWESAMVGNSTESTYFLSDPDAPGTVETNSRGFLREGPTTFVAFVDENSDGKYSAGELYGFVRNVDVGWQGAKLRIELTHMSPIFARLDLTSGTSDRPRYWGTDSGVNDLMQTMTGIVESNRQYDVSIAEETLSGGTRNHVRIVPYLVAGSLQDNGIGTGSPTAVEVLRLFSNGPVVAEFDVDTATHPFITEADFVNDGAFDIFWDEFDAFATNRAVQAAVGNITSVQYGIVLGTGKLPYHVGDTNTPARVFSTLIERRYQQKKDRTKPSAMAMRQGEVLYGGQPTFTWRLDEPTTVVNGVAPSSLFGCSYTAFQIQIAETNGTVVFDSGVQLAPRKDSNGVFTWTAPLVAGQTMPDGKVFAKAGDYQWRVAMYNAKFKPAAEKLNGWSTWSRFSTAVGQQQIVGDHGYGSVMATVKYTGPKDVLSQGVVRVQAFTMPDFSGTAIAETAIADAESLENALDATPNVALEGLPNEGTYYVRAYIDTNSNGVKDIWESWGAAKDAVTIRADTAAPTVGVWIEDSDTDHDWIPDAWEVVKHGDLTTQEASVDPEGKIQLKTSLYTSMTSSNANISKYLDGVSLTLFHNLNATAMLLGLGTETTAETIAAIRAAVEKQIVPNTVKVGSLVVDAANKKVYLTVNAEVADSIAGQMLTPMYVIPDVTLTVTIYKKGTLLEKNWTKVKDYEVKVSSKLSDKVALDIDEDLSSGFYTVEVSQKPTK